MRKNLNKMLIILSAFLCSIVLTSCEKSQYDFDAGALHFTCLESSINKSLFVCDQTNVLYLSNGNHDSFSALIKEDGTAYTLDDYKKDCSQARLYREDTE